MFFTQSNDTKIFSTSTICFIEMVIINRCHNTCWICSFHDFIVHFFPTISCLLSVIFCSRSSTERTKHVSKNHDWNQENTKCVGWRDLLKQIQRNVLLHPKRCRCCRTNVIILSIWGWLWRIATSKSNFVGTETAALASVYWSSFISNFGWGFYGYGVPFYRT